MDDGVWFAKGVCDTPPPFFPLDERHRGKAGMDSVGLARLGNVLGTAGTGEADFRRKGDSSESA